MKRQFLGRLLSLFLVGTVVAGVGCKDYDDDITSLNNRIDELTTGQIASVEKQMQSLQNAVDRLDGVDSGLKDEIEALQGKAETQAGEIGKLQEELGKAASASEVEALKKQIETLESDKGKLEKRIEALESARTSLQDEIDAVKGSLANYLTKSDAEATYATKTTVESLSQLLNQIKANYVSAEGLASTLEGYVTDAELADYPTLTVLQEAIRQSETAMKNSLGEAMKPILAKYNFVQKDVLDLEIQDLQEQIDALSGKPDADGSLANIKSRLEALENAEIKYDESNAAFTKGVEDCIGKALANDGAIGQAIANAIKDVAGEYEGTMQDLKNLIDGLRMDVDQLLSRIQSLVYVPAYDDHKASVNALYYAPEGEEPVLLANGTVEMTFRVTPVEAAGQLVAAYAAEPEMFSLEMEQVKTRATVPALNIQKVEADETGNGRFIVTALPADFTPDFFTGKVSYSIALRVQKAYDAEAGNDYSANVVSDYVNLVPARADVKAVVLAPAKEDGSIDADRIVAADGEVAYEIPYDDTDMVVELMKGYKLWATDGEAYYDLAQLADMGYSLEAPVVACTSKAFKADGTELESADKGNFEVANGGEEVCDETVKLIAADKSTRNNYLLTEHAYTVAAAYDALNPTFNSRVTIVKTKRGVTLDLLKYVWNYSDFRTVYEAGGEYEGSEREFTLKVTESTLPQDITPENIVTYWNQGGSAVVKAVELDAEGKPTETVDDNVKVVPVAYDADEGYTLRVSGYTFGKRYAVEASSEFENVQVTIAFEAEFVALPEKIEVTLPAATLAYDATEELFVAEDTSVVGELFEQVKDHFTDAAELATSLTRPYYGGSPNSANAFYTAVCGDRTLEKNYWFLDGSNPATITRIAVANDGKMTSHMQVNRADVETDADVFAFETKLVPNYGLPIYVKGEARVEIPAYAAQHVDAWVYNADGKWQSDVKGLWSPSFGSSALTGFSVADIDLESAFTIVKKDAQGVWVPVSDDEIAAQKLVFAYEIPATAPAHDGIEIAGNKLSYYGRNESVPVVGTLSIDGIVIGNAFTAVNDYTSYEVNKFDPIRSFTQSETVEIPTRTAEATYTKNICEVLSLRDMRDADDMKGFELIDHDATLADPWITGDDTNGFATGVRPNSDKVFGLEAIRIVSFSVTYADNGFDASAALGDRVTVDETTGQITFSNLNNLSLQKDVDVTVNVEVAYPWAVKSGKVTYKILK